MRKVGSDAPPAFMIRIWDTRARLQTPSDIERGRAHERSDVEAERSEAETNEGAAMIRF